MHSRVERHRRTLQCAGVLALAPWLAVGAQSGRSLSASPARRPCDGDTVTAIDVRSSPSLATGLVGGTRQAVSKLVHVPHTGTRPAIITAYLRIAVGDECTEHDRRESERLLRAQPFLASAAVRTVPDTPGHVRLVVDVVDEIRPMAGASLRRGTLSSLLLGTQNLGGRGLTLAASGERGFAYRNGFGARAVQYGMFGRPDVLFVEAERGAVDGERLTLELAEPYLTDLQQRAYHASTSLLSGYSNLVRPQGADVSMFVRRTFYDIGWVTRIHPARGRRTIALVGAALFGEDVRTGRDLVVISDTGLVTGAAPPLAASYPAFATTRVAAIGGLRALRFATVRGFDALTAEQDLGIGVQFDVLFGSNVLTPAHAGDVFVAADLYAGAGSARSFVVARALAEARGVKQSHSLDGVVASGRLAWYGNASGARSHQASLELSTVQRLAFPLQLTFRDSDGGLPGYGGATYAGGRRMVARVEERRLIYTFGSRADLAVAVFAAAGKLWAGDVPYGRTTVVHGAAGISLLAAYPAGGKRTYRVDLAVPFSPERGGAHLELRFSAKDRTRLLWLEPADVERARTGAVPVSLMKW